MFGRVSNVGRNACDGERIRYKRTIESRFYTPPGSIYVSRISLDAREKDGLNEASIKSPFIAATGAIRLREQILKLETNASTWTGISIDRAHPSNHLRNPYVPSTLEEASRWPPSKQTKSKFLERSIQESRPIHRKCGHPHPPDWSPQFARGRGLKTKRAPLKY